jgi:hypothetical protein
MATPTELDYLKEHFFGTAALQIFLQANLDVAPLQDVTFVEGMAGTGDVFAKVALDKVGGVGQCLLGGVSANAVGHSQPEKILVDYGVLYKLVDLDANFIDSHPDGNAYVEQELAVHWKFLSGFLINSIIYGMPDVTGFKGLKDFCTDIDYSNGENVVDAGGSGGDGGLTCDAWLIRWATDGCSVATPPNYSLGVTQKFIGRQVYSYTSQGEKTVEFHELNWIFAPQMRTPKSLVRICNLDPVGTENGKFLTEDLVWQANAKLGSDSGTLQLISNREQIAMFMSELSGRTSVLLPGTSAFGMPYRSYYDMILRSTDTISYDTPLVKKV